jgi:hypothetical protein
MFTNTAQLTACRAGDTVADGKKGGFKFLSPECEDTVDRAVVFAFELIVGRVTQMGRTQRVRQREQRMRAAHDRLFFIHVDRGEARPALFQSIDEGPLFDEVRGSC